MTKKVRGKTKKAIYVAGQQISTGWRVKTQLAERNQYDRMLFEMECVHCGCTKVSSTADIYKMSATDAKGCAQCMKRLRKPMDSRMLTGMCNDKRYQRYLKTGNQFYDEAGVINIKLHDQFMRGK